MIGNMLGASSCLFVLLVAPGLASSIFDWKHRLGDFEYSFIRQRGNRTGYSWYEAEEMCNFDGARLASILSEAEYKFLKASIKDEGGGDFWTGFYTLDKGNTWQWLDGSPDTNKLALDESLRRDIYESPNKRCVLMYKYGIKTRNCGDKLSVGKSKFGGYDVFGKANVLCKRRVGDYTPEISPASRVRVQGRCPDDWKDPGTNRCYKLYSSQGEILWQEAERFCLSLPLYRPNLACATIRYEINNLTSVISTLPGDAKVWFGLYRERVLQGDLFGSWTWADNSKWTGTNFHRYIQRNIDSGYGYLDKKAIPSGSWDVAFDAATIKTKWFICQVEKDPNYVI